MKPPAHFRSHSWRLAWLPLALAACTAPAPESHATLVRDLQPAALNGRPLKVTTTANIVGDLARVIGAERVQVTDLMGPGVDPHLFKASARDVRTLQGADLVLYGGLHLEGKMVELLEKNRKATAVTQNVPKERLLYPQGGFGGVEGLADPHVWFDVDLWKTAAETTRDALSAADPAGQERYAQNAAAYLTQLDALDREVATLMNRVPKEQRVLVTAHDAFGYFGKRYGVEVRGVQGVSTASEAGTRNVQELAQFVASRRIPALFVESSVPQRTVQAVISAVRAQGQTVQIGGQLFSDALGSAGTPEATYLGMVRHNVQTISSALAPRAQEQTP
ncbi:zinc ABC transporter substrate-binding protein [Deinococcus sp. HMF7604]|uniref:metal ABC transporter solute-binding protein, Zn/Mn family n=1 Tax=Deinococcus betulae TaxID=2873312 RepID=UPI001CCB3B5E|nr:zinc ABC transporter substrate-binding protein [Deinococcus betulae]MBZ9749472.1 zinc ABC transporter substrate-binding protein [Deinococcus betulae]